MADKIAKCWYWTNSDRSGAEGVAGKLIAAAADGPYADCSVIEGKNGQCPLPPSVADSCMLRLFSLLLRLGVEG